jgi:AmpD protein
VREAFEPDLRIVAGRFPGARWCPSPNCDPRPVGVPVELLVIHAISLPPGCFGTGDVDALFTNCLDPAAHPAYHDLRGVEVSSHLLIERDGALVQYVPFHLRAWHAGRSTWCGRERCNDFSIGIELEGTDTVPYADAQYASLARVIRRLRAVYRTIGPDAVVGHADVAPGRKTDPGPAFDWDRLHRLLAGTPA